MIATEDIIGIPFYYKPGNTIQAEVVATNNDLEEGQKSYSR
jgi:hypothetical protein